MLGFLHHARHSNDQKSFCCTNQDQDPTQKEQEDQSRSYREEKREEKENNHNRVRDTIRRATWRLFKRDSGTGRSVDSVVENVDSGTSDSSKTLPKDVADAVQRFGPIDTIFPA